MAESDIELFVDDQRLSLPADIAVADAAKRALGALGRAAGAADSMVLARENGEALDQDADLGEVCEPGERLKLDAAPAS
jgi:hypothetical protein